MSEKLEGRNKGPENQGETPINRRDLFKAVVASVAVIVLAGCGVENPRKPELMKDTFPLDRLKFTKYGVTVTQTSNREIVPVIPNWGLDKEKSTITTGAGENKLTYNVLEFLASLTQPGVIEVKYGGTSYPPIGVHVGQLSIRENGDVPKVVITWTKNNTEPPVVHLSIDEIRVEQNREDIVLKGEVTFTRTIDDQQLKATIQL